MPRLGSIASIPFLQAGEIPTFALTSSIINPNNYGTRLSDFFGISIGNNNSKIIVGSLESDDTNIQNGKAYVYDTTGKLENVINNPNPAGGGDDPADNFGRAVAVSDNYILISAWSEDNGTDSEGGAAYLYDINDLSLVWTFINPDSANIDQINDGDRFGSAVAVTDAYSVVAAFREDGSSGGDNTGWIYVYNNATGTLLYSIENPNVDNVLEYPGDQLGELVQTLAASGNYAVVGSWRDNSSVDGLGDSGAIHIINLTNGSVTSIENPNNYGAQTFDRFGRSVDIYNDLIIVGATGEDTATNTETGVAYVFQYNTITTNWDLILTVDNPNDSGSATSDAFGEEVAITANYFAVASINENNNSGVVYTFDLQGELIATLTNPNIYGTPDNDQFGHLMSASPDYLAISTPAEDSDDGTNSGAMYIYKTGL